MKKQKEVVRKVIDYIEQNIEKEINLDNTIHNNRFLLLLSRYIYIRLKLIGILESLCQSKTEFPCTICVCPNPTNLLQKSGRLQHEYNSLCH